MAAEHEFDVAGWCRRCGCGVHDHKAVPGGVACTSAGNVVAISHLVRPDAWSQLEARLERLALQRSRS